MITDSDFLRPVCWYERWRSIESMRSIATKVDHPDLYTLAQKAESAATVEDDRAFLEAVGEFLGVVAQSGR